MTLPSDEASKLGGNAAAYADDHDIPVFPLLSPTGLLLFQRCHMGGTMYPCNKSRLLQVSGSLSYEGWSRQNLSSSKHASVL